jgi:hemoglobin
MKSTRPLQRTRMKHATCFSGLICCFAFFVIAGCGGEQQSKQKEFFTSGNREADQRADQRMAQHQQLTGESNSGTGTVTKSQAVLANDKKPLYDRIGGAVGIKLIVDDFVARALADPRVNFARVGVKQGGFSIHHGKSEQWDASEPNVKILKLHFEEFMALATGGPSKYTGTNMTDAHAHMHITNPEFDAAMGDLKATLDKLQIANQEQKELLAVIETTRDQIVQER